MISTRLGHQCSQNVKAAILVDSKDESSLGISTKRGCAHKDIGLHPVNQYSLKNWLHLTVETLLRVTWIKTRNTAFDSPEIWLL